MTKQSNPARLLPRPALRNMGRPALAVALAVAFVSTLLFTASTPTQGHADPGRNDAYFDDHVVAFVVFAGEARTVTLPAVTASQFFDETYSASPTPTNGISFNTGKDVRTVSTSSSTTTVGHHQFTWTASDTVLADASMQVSISVIPEACDSETNETNVGWKPANYHSESWSSADRTAAQYDCSILISMLKHWKDSGSVTLQSTWPNWSVSTPITQWDYVTFANKRVEKIDLGREDLKLKGNLPPQTGGLGALKSLRIASNPDLTGSIPVSLGELSSLETLNLYGNALSGSLPLELFDASKLKHLYLSHNKLTGAVDRHIADLSDLESLYLNDNDLGSATIFPVEAFDSTNGLLKLKKLHLGGNNFTNEVSDDDDEFAGLGNLTDLTVLSFRDNLMDGDIMDELAKLTKLTILDLQNNTAGGGFQGDISKLKSLTELKYLKLGNNEFGGSGGIPSDLKALTKLRVFELNQNTGTARISGSFSNDLQAWTDLAILDLSGQRLSGSFPTAITKMTQLQSLDLSGNFFSGSIPAAIDDITYLQDLDLSNNSFSGTIPKEIGNMSHLMRLYLNNNDLQGPMPAELAKLDLLPWGLRLYSNNAFHGTLNKTPLYTFSLAVADSAPSTIYTNDSSTSVTVEVTTDVATQWAATHKALKAGCSDRRPVLVDDPNTTDVNESCLVDFNNYDMLLRINYRVHRTATPNYILEDSNRAGADGYGESLVGVTENFAPVELPFANGALTNSYTFTVTGNSRTSDNADQKLRFYLWAGFDNTTDFLCTNNPNDTRSVFRQAGCSIIDDSSVQRPAGNNSGGILNGIIGGYTHWAHKGSTLHVSYAHDSIDLATGSRPAGLQLLGAQLLGAQLLGSNSPGSGSVPSFDGQTHTLRHVTSDSTGCLDVSYGTGSDGQVVWTWECNNTAAQDWKFEQRTSGTYKGSYRLVSGVGDGNTYCLDNRGDFATSARMDIWSCVDDSHWAAANQSVNIAASGDGYTLTFVRNSESAWLTTDRSSTDTNGGVGQTTVSGTVPDGAVWRIGADASQQSEQPEPVLPGAQVITEPDPDPDPPAEPETPAEPEPPAVPNFDGQVWEVQHVTSDSTACLDVSYGSATDGQDVWTWDCNDTNAQKWTFQKRTSGTYSGSFRLVSRLDDGNTYCLDNRGDFTTSDRMGIWTCVEDTHGAAANQSVTIAASGSGYTITFVSGNSSVWLSTDRASNDMYGGVGQTTATGTAPTSAVWSIASG